MYTPTGTNQPAVLCSTEDNQEDPTEDRQQQIQARLAPSWYGIPGRDAARDASTTEQSAEERTLVSP